MRRVCGWCGLKLDDAVSKEGQKVSHGICPACRKKYFSSRKRRPVEAAAGNVGGNGDSGAEIEKNTISE